MELSRGATPGSAVFLLSKVGHAASLSFAGCLEPLGLEPRHFALLNFIALTPGSSQQVLSGALEIPASRVVGIVDDLEGRGFVERRPHPTDRRARALHLTDSGAAALQDARRAARANDEAFTARLDASQRDQLIALLTALAEGQPMPLRVHPALADPAAAGSATTEGNPS
jgi:DNA-binding MarR family transcriptional regulator